MKYTKEDSKKDTEEMIHNIHENHDRAITKERISKMIENDNKKFRKQKQIRKQIFMLLALIIILLLALSTMIKFAKIEDEKWLKKCIKNGNGISYCEAILEEINYG